MLLPWNLYLLLPLSLPLSRRVLAFTGKNGKETHEPGTENAARPLDRTSQRGRGSESPPGNPWSRTKDVDFPGGPLSWALSTSEELDTRGVIGEYADVQESTETLLYPDGNGTIKPRSTNRDASSEERSQPVRSSSGGVLPQPTQELKLMYNQSAGTSTGSSFDYIETGGKQPALPASHSRTTDSQLPFLLSGSLPSGQGFSSPLPAGPRPSPEVPNPPAVTTSSWGWTTDPSFIKQDKTQEGSVPVKVMGDGLIDLSGPILHRGAVNKEVDEGDFKADDLLVSKTSATSCNTSNQSWTPTYPDDVTPSETLAPSLALGPALFIPLYSDWNSALATWGFAWEAHIYGLGAVFTVFGLISVVCLLGLPLRCPPGSPYFTLLHLFLLALTGIQAFYLLYDAYNHQDRLPALCSLLLSELPFPCLISAFSLAFLLLSLRSRMRLSLPLANSTSFSVLPKPCLLLCMSLLHFGVSLGCVGLLQLFESLSPMILLFPQVVFVCLTIYLSCTYIIFYFLIKVDSKHIYRLNDNGESGGSPVLMQPTSCPFAKVEDWGRAAGAGVGASLCLLGCGGLQLYGILHALGFGGVDGYGFQPWPWWGYQVGCRLCEIGVCLCLSIIGTHPLFCHSNSSIKTIAHPRPGSWSRLSCSSPSRGLPLPSQGGTSSPVLSSQKSQGKQENLVVCDVTTKGKSEALPLFSIVDPPGNGLESVPKSRQTRNTVLPLPTPPTPPHKSKNLAVSQQSSLDSLRLDTDSTADLRPPSPINLSRSIDQALFSESLFSHSIFGLPRLAQASSSLSLSSPGQAMSRPGTCSVEDALYRTSSCGDVDQDNALSSARPSQAHGTLFSQNKAPVSPEQWDWKGSVSGSTQGLCGIPKGTGKPRSHSWANRGQNFTQSNIPRAIPHLSYHRRYRTLSVASKDSRGSGRLAGTKHLSESKQLEWDLAVQAEFVDVCRQIDALSVCSDTIDL